MERNVAHNRKVFVQIALSAILATIPLASQADRLTGEGTPSQSPAAPVTSAVQPAPPVSAIPVPSKPLSVKLSALNAETLDVEWIAGSHDEEGYELEFSRDGGATWKSVGKTIAGTTELPCSNLRPGVKYSFRVHAFNVNGNSDYSDVVSAVTPGMGTGLTGTYFHRWPVPNQPAKITKMFVRQDPFISFEWGQGLSAGEAANVSNFLVVWTGQVQPLFSGRYTFYTNSDDGARLWVNGVKLIDNWTEHPATEDRGTIELEAGKKYDIRVGYFENDSLPASMSLSWSSENQEKEVIPQTQLYPLTAKEEAALATTSKAAKRSASINK